MASLIGLTQSSTPADYKRKQPTKMESAALINSLRELSGDFEEVKIAPGKKFCNGKDLPLPKKDALIHLLQANLDVFAWSPVDLPPIDLAVIT